MSLSICFSTTSSCRISQRKLPKRRLKGFVAPAHDLGFARKYLHQQNGATCGGAQGRTAQTSIGDDCAT